MATVAIPSSSTTTRLQRLTRRMTPVTPSKAPPVIRTRLPYQLKSLNDFIAGRKGTNKFLYLVQNGMEKREKMDDGGGRRDEGGWTMWDV